MKNYFLPRHLGVVTNKKKVRTRIRSHSSRPSAVLRRKLYREAVEARKRMVAAEQQGTDQPDLTRIYCEVCWPDKVHAYSDPHHIAGRRGTNMYDVAKLRLICRRVHDKIHRQPLWAKSKGLLE